MVVSSLRRPMVTCGQILSRFWLSLILVYFNTIANSMAELCVYRRSVYNAFTNSYEKMLTTTSCPWGCCYKHSSPCCSAPIGLIVGCVLGGVLLVALVIVAICCCCVCRRRVRRGGPAGSSSATRSTTSGSGSRTVTARTSWGGNREGSPEDPAVFRSDASQSVDFPMAPVYDPPPSYDEVMRGETNSAFKPDSS